MSISELRCFVVPLVTVALGALLSGCATPAPDSRAPDDSLATAVLKQTKHTAVVPAPAIDTTILGPVRLPPLADTIAQRLVFVPAMQEWFVAAARDKRIVVDVGRIDIDLKKDPVRLAAFAQAAESRSPLPKGSRLILRGPWGSEVASVTGFEASNGRILANVKVTPLLDSLAATLDPLVASAERVMAGRSDIGAGAGAGAGPAVIGGGGAGAAVVAGADGPAGAGLTTAPCDRTSDPAFRARLTSVAQTAELELRAGDQPNYPRLAAAVKARRSLAEGCFGVARGVVVVTLFAGDYEWVRERVLLVTDSSVKRVTVRDLRFRAHEVLLALDANGDGVDDIAARAWTPRGGGTTILTLTDGARFERLAAGFSYER